MTLYMTYVICNTYVVYLYIISCDPEIPHQDHTQERKESWCAGMHVEGGLLKYYLQLLKTAVSLSQHRAWESSNRNSWDYLLSLFKVQEMKLRCWDIKVTQLIICSVIWNRNPLTQFHFYWQGIHVLT